MPTRRFAPLPPVPPACALLFAWMPAQVAQAQYAPAAQLPGVVVTATRSPEPISNLIADVTAIDVEASRRALSVTELLRFERGVQVTSNGGPAAASAVLIRGGNAGHTLTLIEGFRVSSASLAQTTFEGLPLAHAGRVEVLRGPASGLYGADALAGVVQIFAPTARPGLQITGDAALGQESTRQVSGGLSGGSGNLAGGVRISHDRSDGFNATTPNNFAFNPDRDGYRRNGVSAYLDATPLPDTRLRAIALQNRLESEYDDGSFAGARTDSRTELIGLTGWHQLDTLTEIGFKAGQSTDESVSRASFPGTFESRLLQFGVNATRRLGSAARLQLLAERLEEKVSSTSYDEAAADKDKRITHSIGAVFLGDAGPHLLQASVRADDSDQFDTQTNYSVAYGYRLAGGVRAGVGYGTGFHAPGFNDLYFPNYGRSVIRPERSRSAELGLYWNQRPAAGVTQRGSSTSRAGADPSFAAAARADDPALSAAGGGWYGRVVLFQSRVRDLITFAPVCPDPDPRFAFGCAANVERARIRGLSLGIGQNPMGRYVAGRTPPGQDAVGVTAAGRDPEPAERSVATGFGWYLNLDFIDPRNETTDTRLVRRALRQLSAGAVYGVGRVTVGIDLLAASRRYDDAANLQELGGYAVFNLRGVYRLTPEWEAFATVFNAGDRDHATALNYVQQPRLVMLGVSYRSH